MGQHTKTERSDSSGDAAQLRAGGGAFRVFSESYRTIGCSGGASRGVRTLRAMETESARRIRKMRHVRLHEAQDIFNARGLSAVAEAEDDFQTI
jgi:hypothetical protein